MYTSVYPSVLGRYAEQMLLSMYQILHIWIKPGEENQHLGKQLQIAGVLISWSGDSGKIFILLKLLVFSSSLILVI